MKDFDEYLETRVNIVRKMPRLTRPVSLHCGAANFMPKPRNQLILRSLTQDKKNMTDEPNSMTPAAALANLKHAPFIL